MITVPKHDFLPEAPASPFKTVLLQELKNALLEKRLGRTPPQPAKRKVKHPLGKKYIWARPARHPLIIRADRWCDKEILTDFQTGLLIGFTRVGDLINRIPTSYWHEKYVGLSLGGRLFDINEGETFPREFWGNSIFVLEECACSWLSKREIDQNNRAFPACLRTGDLTPSEPTPPDEKILAKLLELKASGLRRDQIAKKIRSIPGFENVGHLHARRLMDGNLPRGRPRKRSPKN